MNQPRLEPHSLEAEQAVLGSLLIDRDTILTVAGSLKPEDFLLSSHSIIYGAILDLYWRETPTDLITLVGHLTDKNKLDDAGGHSYLAELIASTPTAVHAGYYAGIVAEHATRRRLIRSAQDIVGHAYNTGLPLPDVISGVESAIGTAITGFASETVTTMDELADHYLARIDQPLKDPVFFGMRALDDLVQGIRGGNLTVIASRPAVGKSAMAVQIGKHNVLNLGRSVLLVSLEMSAEELQHRLLGMMTGIDNRKIANGRALTEGERFAVEQQLDILRPAPFLIYSRSTGQVEDVVAKIRDCHARYGLDLVIIDYLQLLGSARYKDNRVSEVSQISRALKVLAMQMDIPIIALAQLNRASVGHGDAPPQLHHLRESGSIEQDANQVMFIHEPDEEQPDLRHIIVAKNRSGPMGQVTMRYNPTTTQFYESESEIVKADYKYSHVPF